MPRHLVITNDYEIFGNGGGDVRQHMIEPTERMARICEKHGAPLTIFFECEEFTAFEQFRPELKSNLGYDPAAEIRKQCVDFVRRGHDLQLHLHPEWVGTSYENCAWRLDFTHPTVDSVCKTESDAIEYIAKRKATIDEIYSEAGSPRKVQVYRAGAFSAQPGPKLLAALRQNEFLIESSVVKGLTRKYKPDGGFDYRDAPSHKGPWRISNDVSREDKAGPIWEFPVYSEPGRRWQQFTIDRLKAKFSKNVPKARRDQMIEQLGIKKTPLGIIKFLFQPIPIKLDYHNVTPRKLLRMIQNAPPPPDGAPDVCVLIGHSKEHINDAPLDEFLSLVKRDSNLNTVSFHDVAKMISPRPAAVPA